MLSYSTLSGLSRLSRSMPFSHRKPLQCLVFSLFQCLHLCLALGISASAQSQNSINIYTWPDYFDYELIAEFERETGFEVKETWYESDEIKNSLFFSAHANTIDILISSGSTLQVFGKMGMLEELNTPQLSLIRQQQLEAPLRDQYPSLTDYATPYTWGFLGIAYRADKISQPGSWMDLFKPDEALRGKISMLTDSEDMIGSALIALGFEHDSGDKSQLKQVQTLLRQQKPYVDNYHYMDPIDKAPLVTGDIWMSLIYNGDALVFQEELDPNIHFAIPEEGSFVWMDFLAIAKTSQNKAGALAFIEFMSRPENSARNARFLHYAAPFVAARKHLPVEHLSNEAIYPSADLLKHSRIAAQPDPDTLRRRNQIMYQLVN